jgi:hypothetical protein
MAMRKTLALILLLMTPLLAAPLLANNKDQLTQELMQASGLKHQIAQLPPGILLGLEQEKESLPKELYDGLRLSMTQAYSAEFIERKVSSTIRERLDEQVLIETLTWLKSDLGKKITALEEAASTAQGYQAIQDYGQAMQRDPPPQKRLARAQQMDEATRATEIAVNVIEAGELGIALGLDSLRAPDEQLGLAKLMEAIAEDRPNLTAGLRDLNIVGFLYTYKTLSDEELDRYLEFLKSEVGVKYQDAATAGLKEALLEAAAETARVLPETIKGAAGGQRA